jgi:hypothetical protein
LKFRRNIVFVCSLTFGIISCNFYAHLEDATQECSMRIGDFLVPMYIFSFK